LNVPKIIGQDHPLSGLYKWDRNGKLWAYQQPDNL